MHDTCQIIRFREYLFFFQNIQNHPETYNASARETLNNERQTTIQLHRTYCHGYSELRCKDVAIIWNLQVDHGKLSILQRKHTEVAELSQTQSLL